MDKSVTNSSAYTKQNVKVMIDGNIKNFTILFSNTKNCKSWHPCISWDTPVARAIQDLEIGEANDVNLPNGKVSRIILLERY